jgi:Icc-related predicted phosphoesterase
VPSCLFASDLHGRPDRYEKLCAATLRERPAGVFLGGDLLAHYGPRGVGAATLVQIFGDLRSRMGAGYPEVFVILGNDDPRIEESILVKAEEKGVWTYAHGRAIPFGSYEVLGYANVPPTPFRLKDWERYDVSRYVDPGCVSPEEGAHSVPVSPDEIRYGTIAKDLEALAAGRSLERTIFLFHTAPYRTALDRAGLDGMLVDGVAMDVHVGSIAVRRLIEERQPLVTLHGHVHESARLSGSWRDRIGRTHAFSAAHDGPELALVRFDPDDPEQATRDLL